MKDMYELLNDIHVDISDDDIIAVSELEKKKLSKELQYKIVKAKKQSKLKKNLRTVALASIIMLSSIVGLSFTTYADNIPFLGSIFKFFNQDGTYVGYDEQAEKLELVKESNGIKISIMDTVFDGRTLFITYAIETSKDLGDRPWLNSVPLFGNSGLSANEEFSKVEDGKYISLMKVNHAQLESLEEIDVNWQIDSISTEINNTGTLFEGEWDFNFHISAVDSKIILVDNTIKEEDILLSIENIKITPMSIIVSYKSDFPQDKKWDYRFISFKIRDDLGNNYTALDGINSGWGATHESMSWSATYEKLDPHATKLFLTPIIELSENDIIGVGEDGKPIKANYRSFESNGDLKEMQLDEIMVNID